jgi:hypothetical protein
MMLFVLLLNQTTRIRQYLHSTRARGTNWLRFGAELLDMRRWWCSTSVEELEVEDWVDSLPSSFSSTASCDAGRGARVLLARTMAGLRRWLATMAHGQSSRAAVAGHLWHAGEAHKRWWRGRGGCGCSGARGCLRWQLGLGAKPRVCEWVLSQTIPTGVILTSVLAGGLWARQERY